MRILTVRQPYAWAIIHGGKDVENRSRNIAGDYTVLAYWVEKHNRPHCIGGTSGQKQSRSA